VRQVGANVTLGAALERLGDDVGAEAAFRAAVGVDGGQAEAWSALGTLLARTGRVGEGEVDLRRAVALDPYLAEARAALGVLLAGQGKLAEAEGELARAARLRPGDAGIANNLLTVRKMISSGRKDGGSEGGRGRNP
jgi:Flp pilus assembly protein TadD